MSSTSKRYDRQAAEKRWAEFWEEKGIYRFAEDDPRPVYAVDTPPPTVSGELHLGHCYSYSQTDFLARFWRMNGYNVYYPMGWDDNGLPSERLVEKRLGIAPAQVGRERFAEAIREVSSELEARYERTWRRLGLSVDWQHTYATVSREAQRAAQYSFLELYEKGLAYRVAAPTIWCPTCRTAIAQAEVDDLERETEYVTLAFHLDDGTVLPIATTRPELLPACVAVFVNPDDAAHRNLAGRRAVRPLFGRQVPILADVRVDPTKGTGIVMCCTFGDSTDVEWWYAYDLPLIAVVARDGSIHQPDNGSEALGDGSARPSCVQASSSASPLQPYIGLDLATARRRIVADLAAQGLVLDRRAAPQTVRVHERCDTPVEFIETRQWFIRLLEHKHEFVEAGRRIAWHPAHMRARYENWVQNLGWDWCISRQRYYGVPFPLWYCRTCGGVVPAERSALPVNPLSDRPPHRCTCGSSDLEPETDIMDTWATSSLTPQIAGRWLEEPALFARVFPMSLRPHAHEIIRTWTFYTIVKSLYHLGQVPWSNVVISGFGLLPKGAKLSKSRDGGPLDPFAMMDRYSADAVRYWAASTGLGHDSVVSEDKIATGGRLVTKLWNVAQFAHRFLEAPLGAPAPVAAAKLVSLPADAWLLSRLQRTVERASAAFREYDHAGAKEAVETFFWSTLADNYLEMVKGRLYELPAGDLRREAARYALHTALLTVVKLLAPILPYITEEVYQLYATPGQDAPSVHLAPWPTVTSEWLDEEAERVGEALVAIAGEVRRFKTARRLPLGSPLARLALYTSDERLRRALVASEQDIRSVTRTQAVEFVLAPSPETSPSEGLPGLWIGIAT